jgi:hypothetical protein
MAHPAYVKEHAIRLRVEKHLSVDEIAERLALARTTIYYWVNHIPLGRDRQWSVGQKRAHEAVRARYQRLRHEAYARGRRRRHRWLADQSPAQVEQRAAQVEQRAAQGAERGARRTGC